MLSARENHLSKNKTTESKAGFVRNRKLPPDRWETVGAGGGLYVEELADQILEARVLPFEKEMKNQKRGGTIRLTHSTFFEKKFIRHQGGNNYAMYYNFNWKKCNL